MGPPSPNDHSAWSPPLGPSPWSGTTPATAQTPCGGSVSTYCVPGSPTRPAPWPRNQPVSARRPGGAAAGTPAKRRPRATVDLVAAGHGRPPHHRLLVRPDAGDHPPADTGGTSIHCAQPAAPTPATPGPARRGPRGGSARTAQACPSGHLDTGHRTLDVRSTGWTDVPRRDRGADRATTSVAGVRTSSRRRPPAGRPDLTRVTAPGGARPPGRPRGDGTCAGALTAATGSCPAPPGMRPRPGALLSSERIGSRLERNGGCHPVHGREVASHRVV
jgi:hypothetical protein